MMYETFEAFRPHFNALARVGYFKFVSKSVPRWKYRLHYYYRILVWIGVVTYNIQFIIQGFQTAHCTEELLGTLFILLTTLNTLGKQLAFNVRVKRIDNMIDIISGKSFATKNQVHENIAKANAQSMFRLLRIYQIAAEICGALFTVYPFINRATGQETVVSGYFPFNTNEAPIFHIATLYMGIIISLQAYGHVSMDCTIVSFYAQAKTQLKIFRYDLKHLFDDFFAILTNTNRFQYIDEDINHKRALRTKFLSCMDHFEQIVWFANEIDSIFGEAMILQFFAMAWVICITMYKIVGLTIFSAEFITIALYLGCMLAQLYIYCYFGTHLKVESELVNDSIYRSEWLSLSPAFRRRIFLLMERCKRTLEPRTAYVIPMSLDTYISILRSSYALFTILDR